MKVIDLINERIRNNQTPFYSFEYFPPKTEKGVENLYERLDRMSALEPLWIDVTWGAGGSTSKLTLEICHNAQNFCGLETMMHLTCTNISVAEVKQALDQAKASGIQNILALRGDPPRGEAWTPGTEGLTRATDLVKLIRAEYGDYFCIAVAGYPEGHTEATSFEDDVVHLKSKMAAGADLIVTQLFYDTEIYREYVKSVRAAGITCPIIPGVLPIQGYAGFQRMTSLCRTKIPREITDSLEPIKNDDEMVKEYGVQLCMKMCRELIDMGSPGVHFYTLNLEKSTIKTLEGLELLSNDFAEKPLPWASHSQIRKGKRGKEDVRPIFWRNRPKSYIDRTNCWDEFPNGRWTHSNSPAFGELTDYHLHAPAAHKEFERREAFGRELTSVQSVFDAFAKYCAGEIDRLPWSETPLALESNAILTRLVSMNKRGFLTINSQPRVNGAASTDEVHGWGPKGGYVYQKVRKAYLEFFTSPENFSTLQEVLKHHPSISFHAVDRSGKSTSSYNKPSTTAVTWGVFPGREIIQPTVVDSESFLVWKDEAFALWTTQWISLYKAGSQSVQILEQVRDTFYLVNIVDNNFVDGNIFDVVDEVLKASGRAALTESKG
ncbi:methylenetetrahydrofolate reductase [Planoprotostelium fungivorum]|uniref:Methylenetetrahydrofolate reductase n=1 Tax=Planoprotostelium fungivorum TaxID=1890364 RepID=A0A2P6NQS9_9EUKA|nr:methylenetetrahydrofolate reductase [Planoprotostelium fungivorum]